jgi:hypothetical protein
MSVCPSDNLYVSDIADCRPAHEKVIRAFCLTSREISSTFSLSLSIGDAPQPRQQIIEPSGSSTKVAVETMAHSKQRRTSAEATSRLQATFVLLALVLIVTTFSATTPIGANRVQVVDESSRSLLLTSKVQPNIEFFDQAIESLGTFTPSPPKSTGRFIEVVVDDELTVTDASSDFDSDLDLDDQFFSD